MFRAFGAACWTACGPGVKVAPRDDQAMRLALVEAAKAVSTGDVPVGAVVRALDGPLAPIACASRTAFQPCTDCGDKRTCAVRIIMLEVRDAMAGVLDALSLADMAAKIDGADGVPSPTGAAE